MASQMASKWSEKVDQNQMNAKVKNISLGLYLLCFRDIDHPRKLPFFANVLYSASDPLPRGVSEAFVPDVDDFGLHVGTQHPLIFALNLSVFHKI